MFGGFAGVGQHVGLQERQLAAEERQLHLVHVLVVGHGLHVRVGQLLNRQVLPVVDPLGVFLDGGWHGRGHYAFVHGGEGRLDGIGCVGGNHRGLRHLLHHHLFGRALAQRARR
ncbi:hypothetical protein D9M68_686000 [compost metagenome]